MRIVIIYELPQRELENDLLLKVYFESKKHQCELEKFPFSNPIKLRKKYYNKTDVIIIHSLPNVNSLYNLVYEVFGKVPYIINMQVEQIGTNRTENAQQSSRWPTGIVQKAFHVCWGEKTYTHMLKHGIDSSHLILAGPIQMDSLREEFDGYYFSKEDLFAQYSIDTKQTVCLFISSFSYVGLAKNDRIMLKKKIGEQYFDYFEDLSINSKHGILIWLKRILEEKPDITVIYRMHPAEKMSDDLIELANEHGDSFKLISDYSVKQWILVSDVLLTWYSTSVAEAFFADKEVMVLRPVHINHENEVTLLNDTCNIITEYKQFVQCFDEREFSSLNEANIRSYYNVDSSVPSFIRIGDAISNIISDRENVFPWDNVNWRKYKLRNWGRSIKWYIMQVYYCVLFCFRKVYDKTGITFGKDIQRRIKNKIRSDKKEEAQQKEIDRIMRKEKIIKKITKSILIKADGI